MKVTSTISAYVGRRKEKKMAAAREESNGDNKVSLSDVKSKFKAPDGLKFKDVSNEEFRTYVFDNGAKVTIRNPVFLNVSKTGGHRVYDAEGVSHYMPYKWIHLFWKSRDGKPNFTV